MRAPISASAVLIAALATAVWAGGDWNDDGIEWRSFEDGLAEAKRDEKPICLVVYTEWCPHCTNYAGVFHDRKVEQLSKEFVMVRLDQDASKHITGRFAPDGSYIPRTLFLNSAGEIDESLKIPRAKYVYFYDEHDPGQLREAMKIARKKLGKQS